jgi:putative PIN family toxin of toxin-antitoxin system
VLIRVVLDTNVLVSALLFENGRLAWLRQRWQAGAFRPVLAEATARELLRVLTYPRFHLTPADIELVLGELLPWSETWVDPIPSCGVDVRDPHDQVFLDLAVAAGVEVLVSGDADLLVLRDDLPTLRMLPPAEFQDWLSGRCGDSSPRRRDQGSTGRRPRC